MPNESLLSFGIIADIQYADAEDKYNYEQTTFRKYRNALELVKEAVNYWLAKRNNLKFVLQLGDFIDGYNKDDGSSQSALGLVMESFLKLPCPILHLIGNHDLYNFTRAELRDSVLYSANLDETISDNGHAYYEYSPMMGLTVLCIDNYEVSLLGYDKNDSRYLDALKIIEKNNPNSDKNSSEGMMGLNRRFTAFNGGVSTNQLLWIEKILHESLSSKTNIIIAGHGVVYERNADVMCLTWSSGELLALIHRYSGCVCCYLSGHLHKGSDAIDSKGIYHITIPAVVEADRELNSFATADVYRDRIIITGVGSVPSYSIPLRYTL